MVEGVEVSMFISVPPDKLFPHLIDPGQLAHWWLSDATIEPKPGGRLKGKSKDADLDMAIMELAAPKRILLSLNLTLGGRLQQTSVLVELKKEEGGTRVRITHALPARPPGREVEKLRDSWCDALGALKVLAERGPPGRSA
ncbi:MAG TPA: SRPBCC domain-containing protein [Thermoplasmata archaeon]|nr:SRPBCC domain-containing protein [Thermoplasmata archaeon]